MELHIEKFVYLHFSVVRGSFLLCDSKTKTKIKFLATSQPIRSLESSEILREYILSILNGP